MNDAQILAELVARRGAAWVVSAVEIINAARLVGSPKLTVITDPNAPPGMIYSVDPNAMKVGLHGTYTVAPEHVVDTYEPPAEDARVAAAMQAEADPNYDPWDPAVNPDVEARGPGWVKMKRPPTQSEALAADPDRDFGNGPGVQVDADGNVSLAPIPPMPYIEPTIDFGSRPGVNDPTGYEGA